MRIIIQIAQTLASASWCFLYGATGFHLVAFCFQTKNNHLNKALIQLVYFLLLWQSIINLYYFAYE